MQKLGRKQFPKLPSTFERSCFNLESVGHGIVHIGVGGFHRAHMARYTHDLMGVDDDALNWGITGAGLRASDRPLLDALTDQDCLFALTEREDEVEQCVIIGSIISVIDASASTDLLLSKIEDPQTRIVSATVTENGYCLDRSTKTLDFMNDTILADIANPSEPRSLPGILVEGYRRRWKAGSRAFTSLSCDNIQHNGNVLKATVLALATYQDTELATWIDSHASFPNTMVDRITPVPTPEEIAAFAVETGIDDQAALSSELFRQWVIEDNFVSGRPAWEKVGAQFVKDVAPYEFMKLRLLNGSHLAIAALGQLAGYELIDETLGDTLIRRYMTALMDKETGPTLMPVQGIDLAQYKRTLIDRFSNPAIRDTTQRVNTDAPINCLLDPIRDRLSSNQPIDLLALGLAAWLRRAKGVGENGSPLKLMHPLAELLKHKAEEGGPDPLPLLSITPLFGSLGQESRLTTAVGMWLESIYAVGVSATLESAAARGFF